jgi:hypothetical protein
VASPADVGALSCKTLVPGDLSRLTVVSADHCERFDRALMRQ